MPVMRPLRRMNARSQRVRSAARSTSVSNEVAATSPGIRDSGSSSGYTKSRRSGTTTAVAAMLKSALTSGSASDAISVERSTCTASSSGVASAMCDSATDARISSESWRQSLTTTKPASHTAKTTSSQKSKPPPLTRNITRSRGRWTPNSATRCSSTLSCTHTSAAAVQQTSPSCTAHQGIQPPICDSKSGTAARSSATATVPQVVRAQCSGLLAATSIALEPRNSRARASTAGSRRGHCSRGVYTSRISSACAVENAEDVRASKSWRLSTRVGPKPPSPSWQSSTKVCTEALSASRILAPSGPASARQSTLSARRVDARFAFPSPSTKPPWRRLASTASSAASMSSGSFVAKSGSKSAIVSSA
eukprot:Amastigsp_a175828_5.p3 type:complete len:364 gc:universal Amastigsp_a175828_5:215-1306(+)